MSKTEGAATLASENLNVIGEFPCTQTQLRCWVIDQLKPGTPALNVAVRWEIRGSFKASTIEAALRRIVQRHEVLRTRIIEVAGQPRQQVVEAVDFKMPVIDLRNVPAGQRDQRILEIAEETARAPFDLGKPGLFRVSLLMVENDRGILLITAHQSCFDGWSIRVLGREVGEIAAAIDAGQQPELPELPLQYGDYALWQAEYLESYGFETEKTFWKEQLVGAPYFEVPPDRPRGKVKTSHGNILSVAKPVEFSERIDAAARKHQVSLYSHGAAVVGAMLHALTGQSPVLFGSQVAGRDHTELEDLIGVFINNIVLRFEVPDDISFADHIRSASHTVAEALNHQRMPFNKLVELVNPPRDPSRNPLISVNFNLQKAFLEDHEYGGFQLISAPSQSPGVIYDLSFMMVGRPSGWRMSIEYNTDLFDRSTIETFLQYWQDAYELALDHPEAPLSSLAISRRAEPAADPSNTVATPEQVLLQHPAVSSAAVIADSKEGTRSHAFAVPVANWAEPLDQLPQILMQHLSQQFPPDKLPAGISIVLGLPKNAADEIDRAALKVPISIPASASAAPTMAAKAEEQPAAPARARPESPAVRPSHETAELAAVWCDLLGVETIRPTDSFFDLGGHSLMALRMLARVREKFAISPDLELLFKQPTLEGFAAAIFGKAADEDGEAGPADRNPWERTLFKQGTGRCTVYTLNHPFLYYRLANALPDSVTVFNLNMFKASVDATRPMTLEEIAADAIAAMDIGRQPGPIAVVGLCVNGVLAMEVSRQLRERGVDVGLTAIIDSWAPGYFRSLPKLRQKRWNAERRVKRIAYFTRKLFSGRMRIVDFLKQFNAPLTIMNGLGIAAAKASPEERMNTKATELLMSAARNYRPGGKHDPAVQLFRSEANHPRSRALRFGWGDVISQDAPVIDLEGWHEDSLTSNGIHKLATSLTDRLPTQQAKDG